MPSLSNLGFSRTELASQVARSFIGERTFNDLATGFSSERQEGKIIKTIRTIVSSGKKFLGFIWGTATQFLTWSFSEVWDFIVEKTIELANFDWNQTDEEISRSIEQNNLVIANQAGQLVGSGLVRLSSIVVAGGAAIKFPVLAGKIAVALAEETGQELAGQLKSTIAVSANLMVESFALSSYKAIRGFIYQKKGIDPNADRKPWTFAQEIQERIESIPNAFLRQFVEGALDGALDAVIDTGYVVAFTLDDYYSATRYAVTTPPEPLRTLEVQADGQSSETIILQDTQENVENQLNNYLANHSLVNNRDVGTVVGLPYEDWYGLKPQARKLQIEFRGKEKPPFVNQDGSLVQRVEVSIPDAKVGISWNDLKTIRPFTWGAYRATGVFENRRKMYIWGSTESEAKSTLIDFARFSTQRLIQVSVSHTEIQNPRRKKYPTRVYPAFASMLVRKTNTGQTDTTTIDGQNSAMAKLRVPIWRENAPPNFSSFL